MTSHSADSDDDNNPDHDNDNDNDIIDFQNAEKHDEDSATHVVDGDTHVSNLNYPDLTNFRDHYTDAHHSAFEA